MIPFLFTYTFPFCTPLYKHDGLKVPRIRHFLRSVIVENLAAPFYITIPFLVTFNDLYIISLNVHIRSYYPDYKFIYAFLFSIYLIIFLCLDYLKRFIKKENIAQISIFSPVSGTFLFSLYIMRQIKLITHIFFVPFFCTSDSLFVHL